MTFLDISAPLTPLLPTWPDTPGWSRRVRRDVKDGAPVTESTLEMDLHCGTHVDAPSHHLVDGPSSERFPLEAFVGPAYVQPVASPGPITTHDLAGIPSGTERLLFRTTNSDRGLMRRSEFAADFSALSVEAARRLAEFPGLLLVGMDYLSVQPYGGDDETHRVLMRRGIALLEGLDLGDAPVGAVELVALPLIVPGAEAVPVRAVLKV